MPDGALEARNAELAAGQASADKLQHQAGGWQSRQGPLSLTAACRTGHVCNGAAMTISTAMNRFLAIRLWVEQAVFVLCR